jgi:membrane protein YdbS with pleckstrin-like domain
MRMYLPVQVAGLAAFYFGWRFMAQDTPPRKQRFWALFYWLAASISLALDFSALLPLGLLQLLWLARKHPKTRLWLLLQTAVLLPLLILFLLSGQGAALNQTYQPIFLAVQAARLGLSITPAVAAVVLRLALAVTAAIGLAAAWRWPHWAVHLGPRREKLATGIFLMGWLALLLFAAVPRLFTVKRLLVVALPYLALLTAHGLKQWRHWSRIGLPLFGLLISLFILPGQQREPWRQVMADLQETIAVEPGVVWVDELVVPAFTFYDDSETADRWAPLFGRRLPALPDLLPKPGGTLWLVTGNNPYRHLVRLLPADFFAEFEGGFIREEVGIRVYTYRRRLAQEAAITNTVKPPTPPEEWGLLLPSPLDTCGK